MYAFDPGDVHDGRSVDGALVDQSAFYPGEAALDALASELGLRGPVRFRASIAHAPHTASRLVALRRRLTTPGARLEREAAVADVFGALLVERAGARVDAPPAGGALADVALAVGFVDQSHLNLHFRRVTGVTAGRYARGRFLPRRSRG